MFIDTYSYHGKHKSHTRGKDTYEAKSIKPSKMIQLYLMFIDTTLKGTVM